MRKVSIFFAGSTTLTEERNQIKSLANDLNAKYEKKGVQVVVYTYEYLGENQDSYNHFISKEADAAVFVLREKINEYTLEELRQAIEAKKKHGHPHILVFLHSEADIAESNRDIRDTVKKQLGRQHYLDYKDSEDLKTKTRDRIVPIAEKHLKRNRFVNAICACAIAIVLIGLGVLTYISHSNSELLLLAGGGSVANYMEDYKHINLDNRENTLCLRMGSKLAWPLLAEDGVNLSKTEQKRIKCVPVIMSAGKADINDLSKICTPDELRKSLFIMECLIGKDDTLAVYVDNKWFRENSFWGDTTSMSITVDKLAGLLKTWQVSADIFSTSPESGTRSVYKQLLDSKGFEITNDGVYTFHENVVPAYKIQDGAHIFLGSTSYYPKQVLGSLQKFILTDSRGEVCTKDLYLYFPAYHIPGAVAQKCTIPISVIRLLEDLGINQSRNPGFRAVKYEVADAEMLIQPYKPTK